MLLLSKFKKNMPVDKKEITPFISIVISAYNEEKNIGAKLNDIINLDYPQDKREVFVISDSSLDNTDNIVKQFLDKGVKLYRLNEHSGKIAAYRKIFPELKGEIVVFTDATSILGTNSIRNLINNFNDKSVGCAGGLLVYVNPYRAIVGRGEKRYWTYEKKIRELESSLSSLPSVSGTFYAVRRNLYPQEMKDYLADDLITSFNVFKKGYRTVFDEEAICKDFTTLSIKEEMAKRVRITIQNIRGLINQAEIMNPFKYGLFSILVISHKLFRLMVPIFLILLLISSSFLSLHSKMFFLIFISQILFYSGSIFGYFINKKIKFGLGNALFYFCLSNLAILLGIINSLKGRKISTWETIRT